MKPVIIYVDDEPRNLTVFEASMPDEWQVHCFDSAVEAMKKIKEINPWLVISDQKMPQMTGLEFLEVVSQIVPEAVRIVVTGQTEEQTIIQLVRRAKIFDYLTKPWETDILLSQLKKAIEYYQVIQERNRAMRELEVKAAELEKANLREVELRTEIGAWAPAPIVHAIKEKKLKFPTRRDLVAITYDIVNSAVLHDKMIGDKTVRSLVQKLFIQALVKMGGLKESTSGDSVYGHFGAVDFPHNPYVAALSVAQEFRVGLRGLSTVHNIEVECGIALHFAPATLVDVHEAKAQAVGGEIIQRWLDTSSTEVDCLHRMEKLVHELPGSNIIMTQPFLSKLPEPPVRLKRLGWIQLKGQAGTTEAHMLVSDKVNPAELEKFMAKFSQIETEKLAA